MTRLPSFDIAKGIAMIAVVVSHTAYAGVPQSIVDFCFSFHMPLFFFVSGYFCKASAKLDVPYFKKSAKALLFPYAITCIIMVGLLTLRGCLMASESAVWNFTTWTMASLYGSGGTYEGMPSGVIGVGAVWYLFALLWAKMLLAVANHSPYPLACVAIFFIVGHSTGDSIWLPWSIQPALCATLFVYFGQKAREVDVFAKKALPPALWAILLFAWLYCAVFCGQLYMVSNTYAHGAIDVVGGLAGALCIVKGSEIASDRMSGLVLPLRKLGEITLPVFCMHLVELNAVPWAWVIDKLAVVPLPVWISVLLFRVVLIAVLCGMLWFAPRPLSRIYYPSRQ